VDHLQVEICTSEINTTDNRSVVSRINFRYIFPLKDGRTLQSRDCTWLRARDVSWMPTLSLLVLLLCCGHASTHLLFSRPTITCSITAAMRTGDLKGTDCLPPRVQSAASDMRFFSCLLERGVCISFAKSACLMLSDACSFKTRPRNYTVGTCVVFDSLILIGSFWFISCSRLSMVVFSPSR
jgi:hypothetical protein